MAAGILALFPLTFGWLRRLPTHEYTQAMRAPAWFTVVVGVGIALIAGLALARLSPEGAQVFIGQRTETAPLLMVDAYALWQCLLLGAVLAVAAWAPAARRSLVPHTTIPFLATILLAWCAMMLLFSNRLPFSLLMWLVLLMGGIALWAVLFRHTLTWRTPGALLVLAPAGLCAAVGLVWFASLGQQMPLTEIWSPLLSASPRMLNGAVLLLALGWFAPAVYVPWWLWTRREEQAMVWLPCALLLVVAGVATFTRILFLAFPTAGAAFAQATGIEYLFIRPILGWMRAWALLAMLVGAGWLVFAVIQRRDGRVGRLRPLSLVGLGLFAYSLGVAVETQHESAVAGMLWWELAWVGAITIWITGGAMLSALIPEERAERATVVGALAYATASLIAVPFTPGYWGLANLWPRLPVFGLPQTLLLVVLLLTAAAVVLLFPGWLRRQVAGARHPGVGWGILGPFLTALCLFACGLLAWRLAPLFELIRVSLLQAF